MSRALFGVVAACLMLWSSVGLASGQSFVESFDGVGFSGDYHLSSEGSDGGLYLAGRIGFLGLIGAGIVGDAGYRFAEEDIFGRVGVDGYFVFVGLRLDAVWRAGLGDNDFDGGVGYSAQFLLPTPHPIFLGIGGQTFFGDFESEFRVGLSMMFSIDGEPLRW